MPQKDDYTNKPVRSKLLNTIRTDKFEDTILYKAMQVFVTITSAIGTAYLLNVFFG